MIDDEDFVEDEQQQESGEDIGDLTGIDFSAAVVSGTDWTTETIINQINKNNIQLNPNFQRRDAWDKKRKSKFIESLILGLPVPQVVLAERKDQRGAYIVLDGKQRLLSIRQFSAENDDLLYEQLKLNSLEIRKDLKGKSLVDLRDDVISFDDLSAFENQPIRTIVIKNWPSEEFLYHVFLRLNTGSVPLSPQELRQALHPGKFVSFLDFNSSESAALKDILKLKKPDFRMRDAELLLRFISFKLFLVDYSGNLKGFLDNCCLRLNSNWEENRLNIEFLLSEFELAHIRVVEIFGKNAYRKWSTRGYESRFNRAIFDIMLLSLTNETIRNATLGRESELEELFKRLCVDDREFLSSIESTTKSLTATVTRLAKWNANLNDILNVDLPVPYLDDVNIKLG